MNTFLEIKNLAGHLKIDRGELVKLAREVAHDGTVLCLSQLRSRELQELLFQLRCIEARRVKTAA